MHVTVRLAEPFWKSVGKRELDLDLAQGARVSDLLIILRKDYPLLAGEMDQATPHVFVDGTESDESSSLTEGARVHLVWPVAGG